MLEDLKCLHKQLFFYRGTWELIQKHKLWCLSIYQKYTLKYLLRCCISFFTHRSSLCSNTEKVHQMALWVNQHTNTRGTRLHQLRIQFTWLDFSALFNHFIIHFIHCDRSDKIGKLKRPLFQKGSNKRKATWDLNYDIIYGWIINLQEPVSVKMLNEPVKRTKVEQQE